MVRELVSSDRLPNKTLITRLRDQMGLISSAAEINTKASSTEDTGGVYFVTAFNGLLAPYWDPGAGGLLIGKGAPRFCSRLFGLI